MCAVWQNRWGWGGKTKCWRLLKNTGISWITPFALDAKTSNFLYKHKKAMIFVSSVVATPFVFRLSLLQLVLLCPSFTSTYSKKPSTTPIRQSLWAWNSSEGSSWCVPEGLIWAVRGHDGTQLAAARTAYCAIHLNDSCGEDRNGHRGRTWKGSLPTFWE